MTSKLSSIIRRSPGIYTVGLDVVGTDKRLAFDFVVDSGGGIEVVVSSDEFTAYVAHNFGPFSPLMEAVRQFHRTQKIEFP
jgi:hypothetical protein